MNVMILGGAGYVGSRVAPVLAQTHNVTVVDKFWFGDHLSEGIKKIKKDVMELTEADMQGIDVVVFMAGLSNDPMSEFKPTESFIQNAAAPVYTAYIAKRAGVKKYVYASTCSVYGYSPDKMKTEDSIIKCNYPYGVSKYTGEAGLFALADDFFSVVALRKGTISGWSPRMRFDLLINTMYKNLRTTNTIQISNPDLHRPMLAMEDVETVYRKAVEWLETGVYNAVTFNTTLGQLSRDVAEWAEVTLDKRPDYKVNFMGDLRNYEADGDKLWGQDYPEGTTWSILDDIHAHCKDITDFSLPVYSNVERLKELA